MSDFHIVELAPLAQQSDDHALHRLLGCIARLQRTLAIARGGNDDLVVSPGVLRTALTPTVHHQMRCLLALAGPATGQDAAAQPGPGWQVPADFDPADLWGVASVQVPLLENTNQFQRVDINVRLEHHRRGVGRALSLAMDHLARELDRSTLMGWAFSRQSDAPDALRSSASDIAIARDGTVRFLLAMGYRLGQTERHSVQHLAGRRFSAPQVAAGYHIETWPDAPPERLLPLCAKLQTIMSTDLPYGDLELVAEQWDAERYLNWAQRIGGDQDMLTSLAIHDASGEPAGFTQLIRDRARPAAVEQWNTLVTRAHRGHGLGLALKQANMVALAQHWPDAERIHTWNATENGPMWAINERLGYRVESIDSGWQKRL